MDKEQPPAEKSFKEQKEALSFPWVQVLRNVLTGGCWVKVRI